MEDNEEIIELNDGCDCGCGCGDVELLSDKEPEVLLFDEYAELYENEIIRTREAAEATLELVTEKAAAIEAKEDLLLDDTTTIKRELRKGIADIRADIATESESIRNDVATKGRDTRTTVSNEATSIRERIAAALSDITSQLTNGFATVGSAITTGVQQIRGDIARIITNTLEECSEEDIYEMFNENAIQQ